PGLKPSPIGRTVDEHLGDQRTASAFQTEAGRELFIDVLDLHPQPASLDAALALQLLDHGLGLIRRYRKADAYVAPVRREDGRVHPDHLTGRVEHGTTGITAIDGRIDLQVVIVRTGTDVAAARRDDACGRRA